MESGGKILVTIKPSFTKQFESMMFDALDSKGACSQHIRHLNRLVTPSQLENWGIEYDISLLSVVQGFATVPGAVYHMVINISLNLALALNWELPNAPGFPAAYITCRGSCAEEFAVKEHEYSKSVQRAARVRPELSLAKALELQLRNKAKRPAEAAERVSKKMKRPDSANTPAESLVSASRIRKFFELARSQPGFAAGRDDSSTWRQEAGYCYTRSKAFSVSAKHQNLESWTWSLRLVDIIDD